MKKFWRHVWSHRTKSISMQRLLLITRTILLVIEHKGKVENMWKQYFLRPYPLNIYIKITGKAVNLGDNKDARIPCLLQFTETYKMMKILQKFIFKFINLKHWQALMQKFHISRFLRYSLIDKKSHNNPRNLRNTRVLNNLAEIITVYSITVIVSK